MRYNIYTYENAMNTAKAVADLWVTMLADKEAQGKFLHVAVSGGSTPKLLFELLAKEYKTAANWNFLKLFWVDERCVPPTHPESNYAMTFDGFLHTEMIPSKNIFRMKGENTPDEEAARYQQLLQEQLPVENGFPVFDLVMLGMGDDGHTASVFPNQMFLLNTEDAVSVGVHPQSGQKRITLTGKTILQAEKVIFLITGESKASILKEIVGKEKSALQYPAAHVWASNHEAAFYLDKGAASMLT